MKIWAKLMKGDKMLKDIIYEDDFTLRSDKYIAALQNIAYRLDIATPISLPSHLKHFEKFNRVKYTPRDFVEEVDFDLILERVVEDKRLKNYLK